MRERLRISQLKARGWTARMVEELLGDPDELAENPVYRSKAPMALYDVARVERIEQTQKFQDRSRAAQCRAASGVKAAEKKRRQAVDWARAVPITVRRVEDLAGEAVRHYNARGMKRYLVGRGPPDWQPASAHSSHAFLDRIQVNYVRHELTSYEDLLDARYGKVGVDGARFIVRTRVYDAIAQAYPALATECRRQVEERNAREPAPRVHHDMAGRPLDNGRCTTCGEWTPMSRNTVDETGLRCVECRVTTAHRARGCTHELDEPCQLPMGPRLGQWTLGEILGRDGLQN